MMNYRTRERGLMLGALLTWVLGWVSLSVNEGSPPPPETLWLLAGTILAAGLVHGMWVLARFDGDEVLLPLVLSLEGVGLLMQYRLSAAPLSAMAWRSLLAFPLATVALGLVAVLARRGRADGVFAWWGAWYGVGWAIYGVLAAFGFRHLGSRYGPGLTTPGEISKICLVIAMAGFFGGWGRNQTQGAARSLHDHWESLFLLFALWIPPQLLLSSLRDFGSLLIVNVLLLTTLYVVLQRASILFVGGAAGFGLASYVLLKFDYVNQRFLAWFDPWSDPEGQSWQLIQSLFAISAGGFWGGGLGEGTPTRVPIVVSDFIFSAVVEELGWIGGAALLAGYAVIVMRAYQAADRAVSYRAQLFAQGVGTLVGFQALLNIGGVIGLLPITGVTLPFVSKGGTSLVALNIMLGLLLGISDSRGEAGAPSGSAEGVFIRGGGCGENA